MVYKCSLLISPDYFNLDSLIIDKLFSAFIEPNDRTYIVIFWYVVVPNFLSYRLKMWEQSPLGTGKLTASPNVAPT